MAVEDFRRSTGRTRAAAPVEVRHRGPPEQRLTSRSQKAQEFYERSNADLILDVPRRRRARDRRRGGRLSRSCT